MVSDHTSPQTDLMLQTRIGWQNWPSSAVILAVFNLAKSAGAEARLVGGAVRDHLLGLPVFDVDMAVNLPVLSLIEPAKSAGLSVYETGLDHGTITLAKDGHQLELTQLRVDLETDGRHALVALSDDWDEDAKRRDFTVNALYLDETGQLFDPTGGLSDLQEQQLRFIGDAPARLAEDYLRLLRGFRFLATKSGFKFAADYSTAITHALPGLAQLSVERVTDEWCRWLDGKAALSVLKSADEMGVLDQLFGQPLAFIPPEEVFNKLDRWARMVALFGHETSQLAAQSLRLSKADQKTMDQLSRCYQPALFDQLSGPKWQQAAYHLVQPETAYRLSALSAQTLPKNNRLAALITYEPPAFPISGADLIEAGMAPGPEVGATLRALEKSWLDADFTLSKTALLEEAARIFDAGKREDG